jgi:hypothetical protein
VVRAVCGNALLDRGEGVEELLAGGAPKVRMRALTLLGAEAAVAHLTDRSSAVRSMAQAPVLKAGGDPAAHYRAMPISFGMLAGLGETGTAADASFLERQLTDLALLHDPALAAEAHDDLHAWLHHTATTYTTPSPTLAAEIDAACTTLAPALARQIRFVLPKLP